MIFLRVSVSLTLDCELIIEPRRIDEYDITAARVIKKANDLHTFSFRIDAVSDSDARNSRKKLGELQKKIL